MMLDESSVCLHTDEGGGNQSLRPLSEASYHVRQVGLYASGEKVSTYVRKAYMCHKGQPKGVIDPVTLHTTVL